MINAGSIDCGVLYWMLWREFGILVRLLFSRLCLQPKHRVISDRRLFVHKFSDVLESSGSSGLHELVVHGLPLED